MPDSAATPSPSLVVALRDELMRHVPFAQMQPAHVERLAAAAREAYYAPDETVLEPGDGPVRELHVVRRGGVTGRRGLAEAPGGIHYEAGEIFPVGALLGERAVTATYTADGDVFCLLLPAAAVHEAAQESAPFADFLNRRVAQFLDLSRQALQAGYAAQAMAEQSLEAPLRGLVRQAPFAVAPDTPLAQALQAMHERHIGSVLVADADGTPRGILTRHDILGRVTLPQLPLTTPVAAVMSAPVQTLDLSDRAQDAALLMARHGIRHVPVTDGGRLAGIVSERDLFALQRLSLKQVGTTIRAAPDLDALRCAAADIRRFAAHLLGQGVQARALTEMISHLNDLLTVRLLEQVTQRRALDLQRVCWLAFGSEGRGEQTIATDQDNGLIFASDAPERDRIGWIEFAREVNEGLDACGYPLCKGNVMASNPECCLTPDEWVARFRHWQEHGAPEDLLAASIYFDLRPLAGRESLCAPLFEALRAPPPRFLKQLALNALSHRAPLNWRGAIDTHEVAGREVIDLKLQGTAIFVDAARLYALAHDVRAAGTRARLEGAARAIGLAAGEGEAWVGGFEYLQLLRLRVQLGGGDGPAVGPTIDPAQPNLVDVATLNAIDRRVLKECLRVARELQQRLALDYER
ncbi:MAG: CBS domain-containing protein [Piscinibacter sp.]|nr:CBS domain-containing protein [Piscinibacter sp.]